MHISFLKYLKDPNTGESLKLTATKKKGAIVIEGTLSSKKNRYPIVKGIPRFAGYNSNDNYTKNFSYEWHKWGLVQYESRNKGKPMENHTYSMWEKITGIKSKLLRNKLVIDYGCGSGRFIEVCRLKKAKVIGIDLSYSVEVAQEVFKNDENVCLIQADILNPPLKPEVADVAFSIGVLHHTQDPAVGFQKLATTVKKGGEIAISVYGQDGYYTNGIVQWYRNLFKKLWPVFKHYPPLIYTYTVVYAFKILRSIPVIKQVVFPLTYFFPYMNLRDTNWSLLDTFDSITPSYQRGLGYHEVHSWFKKAHMSSIEPVDWGGTSMKGIVST